MSDNVVLVICQSVTQQLNVLRMTTSVDTCIYKTLLFRSYVHIIAQYSTSDVPWKRHLDVVDVAVVMKTKELIIIITMTFPRGITRDWKLSNTYFDCSRQRERAIDQSSVLYNIIE